MRFASLRNVVLLLAACVLSLGVARANDFNDVVFTNFDTGNSIIGSGTFSFDQTLGDGTYFLSSLTNVNFDFTFGSIAFNNSNIDTSDLDNVEVVIYDGGNNFYFNTDCSAGGGSTGCYEDPFGGTLGFVDTNSGLVLSTEPNWFGPLPLNLYEIFPSDGDGSTLAMGYYGTPAGLTPEPDTLLLLGSGLAGMLLRRLRRA